MWLRACLQVEDPAAMFAQMSEMEGKHTRELEQLSKSHVEVGTQKHYPQHCPYQTVFTY